MYQWLVPSPPPSARASTLARTILELDTGEQRGFLFRRELADGAHGVLALDLVTRMHEAVGEALGVVNISRPSVLKSSLPTAIHLA